MFLNNDFTRFIVFLYCQFTHFCFIICPKSLLNIYKRGTNINYICKKYSVSKSSVYGWASSSNKSHEIEKVRSDLKKIQMKLDILLMSNCLPSFSLSKKLECLERIKGNFPVKTMCKVLNVNHGTFYNHILRKVKNNQNKNRDFFLKTEIKNIFNDSEKRFGTRKIIYKLKQNNISVSQRKVSSIMKELKIKPIIPKKKIYQKKENTNKYFYNKIKRVFITDRPNRVWVSDLTNVYVRQNVYYL